MSAKIDPIQSTQNQLTINQFKKTELNKTNAAGDESVITDVKPKLKTVKAAELLTQNIVQSDLAKAHGNLDEDLVKSLLSDD